ncbi:hypothetical protein [Aliidiomarina maris]|nr:hypothetical protein [Aliidiomarina maris]RAJ92922.1 hypothetical protein B0I24_1249 [Aliidiomarina maris]
MDEDRFHIEVSKALSSCQLVEEVLKLYISESYELARKCIDGKLVFKLSGEDVEDASLERLITTFRKLTDNEKLVAKLNKFKSERNYLSHKAIAHCLDPMGNLDWGYAGELKKRLDRIQQDSHDLRLEIHEEAKTFRAHLYF